MARDAKSLSKVIAQWIADNHRANSPKFILGESYGGFRAAKVARELRREHGIAVAGIMMVSPLMEGTFTFGGTRFALGAAMQIPTLAAAELERKGMLTPERLAEAERFALGEYLTTLAGAPPRGDTARAFYARVAEITGMPLDVVTKTRGFIRDNYVKHLRAAEGLVVSRYDITFTGVDPHPESATPRGPDPLLSTLSRTYSGAMSVYVREELGYKTDMTYVLLSREANNRWDWGGRGSGRDSASVDEDLRDAALARSVVPAAGGARLCRHGDALCGEPLRARPPARSSEPARAQLKIYRGGHMFYIDDTSRVSFTNDARSFYAAEPQHDATRLREPASPPPPC